MVRSDYPALSWLRRSGWCVESEGGIFGWQAGYILGFLNGAKADNVTQQYVKNVMNARARGVSA